MAKKSIVKTKKQQSIKKTSSKKTAAKKVAAKKPIKKAANVKASAKKVKPVKAEKKPAKKTTTQKKTAVSKKAISKAKPIVKKSVSKPIAAKPIIRETKKTEKVKKVVQPEQVVQKPKVIVLTSTIKKAPILAPGVLIQAVPEPVKIKSGKAVKARRLTEKELQEILARLEMKKTQLVRRIRKELEDSRQRSGSTSADPVDQATDSYDDDVAQEIAATSDEGLELIDAAIRKIKDGTYGICQSCSAVISPSRLKVLPYATDCPLCIAEKEKSKRRTTTESWSFLTEETEVEEVE